VTTLVNGIMHDAQDLLQLQMALFKHEVKDNLRKTKEAARSLSLGAALAMTGGLFGAFMLVHALHEIWPGLRCELPFCFDVTAEGETCCLVFSPEGDVESAKRIDSLVAKVPLIRGWVVFARRQRKAIEDACAIVRHLYSVDATQARFTLDRRHSAPFVEMHLPLTTELTPGERQGLIDALLWHVLGEDTVMSQNIRCRLVPSAPPPAIPTLSFNELVQAFS
jgi:hypothetical protein